jgi:heavy metal sensor kinase
VIKARSLRYRMTVLHAALLAGSLALLCVSVYFGVRHYLDLNVRHFLSGQCHAISQKLLANVGELGEDDVVGEMNEHYAPEIIEEFVRISRADGSVLYQSFPPQDRGLYGSAALHIHGLSTHETFRRVTQAGSDVVINAFPFWTKQGTYYFVEVGAPYRPVAVVLHALFVHLAFGTLVIILAAMVGGFWLTNCALMPVNSITARAEQISHVTINERLPVIRSGDEIERLAIALNRMMGRLENAFRHVDQFSADVSHELRTPLTILQAELEEMGQLHISVQLREMIGSALEETGRLARIIDHLLELSRIDSGVAFKQRVSVDLGALAVSTADQMQLLADEKSISLIYAIAPDVEVEGDPIRLRQVVANLLDNAIRYSPEGGWVKIVVAYERERAGLRIIDNGIGIPPNAIPHIFDRFYRADWARARKGGGVGLGLSIVKAICTAHDAEITVSSIEGEGSCFAVAFGNAPLVSAGARGLSASDGRAQVMTSVVMSPPVDARADKR